MHTDREEAFYREEARRADQAERMDREERFAVPSPLVRDDATGVWMRDGISVARHVAVDAMMALGYNPDDFRLRDMIIVAISGGIDRALDDAAKQTPREPT